MNPHSLADRHCAGLTLATLQSEGAAALRAAGIENPRHEARLLLQHATGLATEAFIADPVHPVTSGAAHAFDDFIRRRTAREPIAYILGRREFWSLEFGVSPDVLIPRPDSETLIEAVLGMVPSRTASLRVLDLGTGSGCLLIALLRELPGASGVGVDRSEGALRVAARNAGALGVGDRATFVCGDWTAPLRPVFDIVVANPPYVREDEMGTLEPDVARYEPRIALAGGADGIEAYRRILASLTGVLDVGALLALEFGQGQAGAVQGLVEAHEFAVRKIATDLSGRPRCIIATPRAAKKSIGLERAKG